MPGYASFALKTLLLSCCTYLFLGCENSDVRFINPMDGEFADDLDGIEVLLPRTGKASVKYQIKLKNDSTYIVKQDGIRKVFEGPIVKAHGLYFVNKKHQLYPKEYLVIHAFKVEADSIYNFRSIFSPKPYGELRNISPMSRPKYFKDLTSHYSDATGENIVIINNEEQETLTAFQALVAQGERLKIRRKST